MTTDKIFAILAVLFLLMGILIRTGRGDLLLRGFVRNMKEKESRYNMPRLRAFVAHTTYLCAFAFAIMTLGAIVSMKWITWVGILLFLIIIIYATRYTEQEANFQEDGEKAVSFRDTMAQAAKEGVAKGRNAAKGRKATSKAAKAGAAQDRGTEDKAAVTRDAKGQTTGKAAEERGVAAEADPAKDDR